MRKVGFNLTKLRATSVIPELRLGVGPVFDIISDARTDNRTDDIIHDINTFSTGLVITPQPGFIGLVTGSEDLQRAGYFLPSPIIINQSCTSELVIPLYKFSQNDIELPFTIATLAIIPADDVFIQATNAVQRAPVMKEARISGAPTRISEKNDKNNFFQ